MALGSSLPIAAAPLLFFLFACSMTLFSLSLFRLLYLVPSCPAIPPCSFGHEPGKGRARFLARTFVRHGLSHASTDDWSVTLCLLLVHSLTHTHTHKRSLDASLYFLLFLFFFIIVCICGLIYSFFCLVSADNNKKVWRPSWRLSWRERNGPLPIVVGSVKGIALHPAQHMRPRPSTATLWRN